MPLAACGLDMHIGHPAAVAASFNCSSSEVLKPRRLDEAHGETIPRLDIRIEIRSPVPISTLTKSFRLEMQQRQVNGQSDAELIIDQNLAHLCLVNEGRNSWMNNPRS